MLRSFFVFFLLLTSVVAKTMPNSHAPIALTGEHVHKTGEWMLSYSNMQMTMEDLYIDDSKVSVDRALDDYMMTPTEMKMQMHMFGLMYAISDKVTLMAMTNYLDNEMTMINRMSVESKMESSGFSDISLTSLHDISEQNYLPGNTILQVGISIPTGSITETEAGVRVPYKMQLGSGTFDPKIQLVNRQYVGLYTLGSAVAMVARFGHNDEGYRLGNEYNLSLWVDRNFNDYLSASVRVNAVSKEQISGSDSAIEATTTAARDAELQNGDQVDLSIGVNYLVNQIKGLRFAAEYSVPVYQNINGPMLGVDNSFTLGVQYSY